MSSKEIIEFGTIKGELCGRNGCEGIIDEHEKEGCCSCHINPPCGYCTSDTSYCPKCEWAAEDDREQYKPSESDLAAWAKQAKEWQDRRDLFYKKYRGKSPIDKLEMRTESHTHFTQKVIGVFPKGTETAKSILPKVEGTFGGRFSFFGETKFEYIAYTD